ncbi:EamA family transporter [Agromyces protaetiae]|uniref:EamA family transporter n=1 Tax=Agromyces protaetiae TaxID=2509455 RepID=A0A4P6FAF9_9MICO|nr:EamA family transporter [Agromyces protaetiae]
MSPLIALLNSAVPVAATVVLGQSLGPVAWIAISIAILGSVLIGIERGERVDGVRPRTIAFAVVAGLGLGFAAVALDQAPSDAGIIPVLLDAGLGAVVLGSLAALARVLPPVRRALAFLDEPDEHGGLMESAVAAEGADSTEAPRRWLPLAIAAGVLTAVANICLMLGLLAGNVAVVAVLINLYPVSTMVLAWLVLRERLSPVQTVGAVLAVVASVLLGTG